MATYAYLRTSTDTQDLGVQRLEIYDYAHKNKIHIDEFIEVSISSRKGFRSRRIDYLLSLLKPEDTIIVTELSRLGRSLSEVILLMEKLTKAQISVYCIKQGLNLAQNDMTSKVMMTMFSLFGEIERELISERTKKGLAKARASGKVIGRPKGSFGPSKLEPNLDEVRRLIEAKVPQTAIGRLLGCSPATVSRFIARRGLKTGGERDDPDRSG